METKQGPETDVINYKRKYESLWRDRCDAYWLERLAQEVDELKESLNGMHGDSPEWEIRQIASICINWLERKQRDGELFYYKVSTFE